ncbi:hypothetical protein [Tropicimonas sp. S265A]|uniref:hypothetical protein n=1 Tax=Tropicimonas sp. S265A TaxID=3415134 RepID=UPI003C7E8307
MGSKKSSYLASAKGASRFGSDWVEYNGGIQKPKRIHLNTGQRYYRFASSRTSRERSQLSGAWWIDHENFMTVTRFINGNYFSVREGLRYFLALPKDWTEVDVLVSAILEAPMDCYAGEGRRATGSHPADRGSSYIPPQHIRICQLYIPMLETYRKEAFPNPIAKSVWKAV